MRQKSAFGSTPSAKDARNYGVPVSQEAVRSLLIFVAVCLNIAGMVSTARNRDRKERSGEWPRHPAVRTLTRTAVVLMTLSGICLAVAIVLFFV